MIETARLEIIPLTTSRLVLYLQGGDFLESQLQLAITGRFILPEVKKRVELLVLPKMNKASGDEWLFYTFWIVVEKQSRMIVAELGFKGPPSEKGEVEIGYGTLPSMRFKGFMKEAVGGLIEWTKQQNGISGIVASIHPANTGSIRVVEANGFKQFEKEKELWWWRLELYP